MRVWLGLTLLTFGLAFVLPRAVVLQRYAGRIHTPATAPARPVAIVFGAGLRRDGTPSLVLADRVAAAAALYLQGRVEGLLLSGSASAASRDEPAAMRDLALALGVPETAITLDRLGDRTFTSCKRARAVFGIEQALLVTQRFHLPRALAICRGLGMEADGVAADLHPYSRRAQGYWSLREVPATLVAVLETYFAPSAPLPPKSAG
ncbi:MAG: YdcF family protein [Anaerolineales bacterium]|nr:YdcF family protein [Anaerolineales bacterium]